MDTGIPCRKIDISSVHLSRIENGKVTPGVDILIRVSEEMHVSIDELLFGKCSLNRELFYIEEKIQKWMKVKRNL